jgi:hypothetical protein
MKGFDCALHQRGIADGELLMPCGHVHASVQPKYISPGCRSPGLKTLGVSLKTSHQQQVPCAPMSSDLHPGAATPKSYMGLPRNLQITSNALRDRRTILQSPIRMPNILAARVLLIDYVFWNDGQDLSLLRCAWLPNYFKPVLSSLLV